MTKVECWHRVIKERGRLYYAIFPFRHLHRMTVIQLTKTVVFYVNAFVWKRSVSQIIAPLTIVEGVVLDYNLHFHVIFGKNVQTFEGINNTMEPHIVDAVALGPAVNLQGVLTYLA